MKWFYLFILNIILLWGCTQDLDSVKKCQEDIDYFFKIIETLHPDPYQYIAKDSLDVLRKRILDQADQFKTVKDLNIALLQCNQYFDGHTNCGIYPGLLALVGSHYLPIEVKNDSVFWLPTGEIVLSVDTFPVKRFITEMKKFVSYDLSPEIKNKKSIDYVSFVLLNHLKPPRYFDLYREGKVYREDFNPALFTREPTQSSPPFIFRYFPEDSMAYFAYNSAFLKYRQQLADTLPAFFDSIKSMDVQHLFIDVRNGRGGSDLLNDMIIAHLYCKSFSFKTEYKFNPKGRRKVLKEWWKQIPAKKTDILWAFLKTYFEDTEQEYDVFRDSTSVGFDKNIYVLQGSGTFSASYDFCWAIRLAAKNVRLVGERVGQFNPICGNILQFHLPNSKIPFRVATNKHYLNYGLPEENGFLMPDIPFTFQYTDSLTREEMYKIIMIK